MDWWIILLILFGSVLVLMSSGLPVAFAFMAVTIVPAFLFWGGEAGLRQLTMIMFGNLANFVWLPVPMFLLMGDILFESGVGTRAIDAVDKLLGRLPGRLGLLAVASGTILAAVSGSSVASTALIGRVLSPEMERRGYNKEVSLGPIMGSGGLAVMIPPSMPCVILASLASLSVSKMLVGGIIPGLIMAAAYAGYIIFRCWLKPSLAPAYQIESSIPFSQKIGLVARHVLPLALGVFMVTGVIFLGIATPSEAAATGVLACLIVAGLSRGLNLKMLKRCCWSTMRITIMTFMLILASQAFSQVLASSGTSEGLANFVVSLSLPPVALLIATQIVILLLGMFMGSITVIMIVVPIFMPVVTAVHADPMLFGLLTLLSMETGMISPPYGLILFTMKGVASRDTTMADIYKAILPYNCCNLFVLAVMIAIPAVALWLPGLMAT